MALQAQRSTPYPLTGLMPPVRGPPIGRSLKRTAACGDLQPTLTGQGSSSARWQTEVRMSLTGTHGVPTGRLPGDGPRHTGGGGRLRHRAVQTSTSLIEVSEYARVVVMSRWAAYAPLIVKVR